MIYVGAYGPGQLPLDIVGRLDGIAIVIFDGTPPRLRDKTIDFKDGHFKLAE